MGQTSLVQIPPDKLQAAWPFVEKHIETLAALTTGDYTAIDLAKEVSAGSIQLWAVLEDKGNPLAVVLTQLFLSPQQKWAKILGLSGEHRDRWIHHLDEIKAWAKANGAVRLRASGRKGWAKHLTDWKVTHWNFEVDLNG